MLSHVFYFFRRCAAQVIVVCFINISWQVMIVTSYTIYCRVTAQKINNVENIHCSHKCDSSPALQMMFSCTRLFISWHSCLPDENSCWESLYPPTETKDLFPQVMNLSERSCWVSHKTRVRRGQRSGRKRKEELKEKRKPGWLTHEELCEELKRLRARKKERKKEERRRVLEMIWQVITHDWSSDLLCLKKSHHPDMNIVVHS